MVDPFFSKWVKKLFFLLKWSGINIANSLRLIVVAAHIRCASFTAFTLLKPYRQAGSHFRQGRYRNVKSAGGTHHVMQKKITILQIWLF
jgi:hypothetical protein